MTPLDTAHAAMLADPEDDAARLRYYRSLADAELFLLLSDEAEGTTVSPRVFPLEDGPVVLAFDTEERMVDFTGVAVPYAALPGRVIVAQLAGQGMGIGLNLGTPDSVWLMGSHAVDWLAAVLGQTPAETRGRPIAIHTPGALEPELAEALEVAVSGAGGLAAAAVLVRAAWQDGGQGLLLAWLGARSSVEPALARALAEALAFSGLDQAAVDMVFLPDTDPVARQILALGRSIPLPPPPAAPPEPQPPSAPGMNPDRPPRLK